MKFNPENKDILSYQESLSPVMDIKDPKVAKQYLLDYIEYIKKHSSKDISDEEAKDIAKSNLGYYAGYFGNDVRERVEKLFSCQHPLFGDITKVKLGTSQSEILGRRHASKIKRQYEEDNNK